MIEVHVERELAFAEDRVWALLSDFGDLTWTEGWDKLETEGEGIGMVRRIIMPGIDPIEETLQSMDHDKKQFSYTIPNMPIPVSDYRAEVSVAGVDTARSKVSWRCTAKQEGGSATDAAAMLEATYDQLLTWVEKALTERN